MNTPSWLLYVAQRLSGINETNTEFKTLEIVKDDVNKDIDPGVDTYYKNGIIHHPTKNVLAAIVGNFYDADDVACVMQVKNNSYKGNIPTILFFTDKFPRQLSEAEEQNIYAKCIEVCPPFKDVVEQTIFPKNGKYLDYSGNEHTVDEYMKAPHIGLFSLYEFDIVNSLPDGWEMEYSSGAEEHLRKLYENI